MARISSSEAARYEMGMTHPRGEMPTPPPPPPPPVGRTPEAVRHESEMTHPPRHESEMTHPPRHERGMTHPPRHEREMTHPPRYEREMTHPSIHEREMTHPPRHEREMTHPSRHEREMTHPPRYETSEVSEMTSVAPERLDTYDNKVSPGARDQTVRAGETQREKWRPYSLANRELWGTSLVRFPALYYRVRWMVARVFHFRIFAVREYFITLGECLIFPAIALALGLGTWAACCDSEATGSWATFPYVIAFLFSSKHSVVTFLTGTPYERILIYHKLFALIAIFLSLFHGLTLEGDEDDDRRRRVRRDSDEGGWTSISGWVTTGTLIAMTVSSFYLIRRHLFNLWLLGHNLFAIALIVFAALHGAGGIFIGSALWLVDFLISIIVIAVNRYHTKLCTVHRLPGDVVRISFDRNGFKYRAGQHVVICVPAVSIFEWHPFSVSSAPHEQKVTLHARVLGDWTRALHDSLTHESSREMTVFVDGPFGSPSVDLDHKYRLFMFVSGGIGITPMQSIVNELMHDAKHGRKIQKILFVWSCRDTHMVTSVLDFDKEYYEKHLPQDLPVSFQPDLLSEARGMDSGGVLESFYHLTKLRSPAEFEQGNIAPSIQPLVKFGRPHLSVYFERMHDLALRLGESDVAVLTCGPAAMIADANMQAAYEWTKDGVTFHFHEEVFEF